MRGLEDIIKQNREVAAIGGKIGDLVLPAGVGAVQAAGVCTCADEEKLFTCQSVVGGWQTFDVAFNCLIGPVFNKITDLWDWQKETLYDDECLLQDAREEALLKVLPHGSGINNEWEFVWLKNGKVKAKNAFHCMNDVGYYDGYADFTVVIPPLEHTKFKLVFNGRQGQNKNRQYLLRDYLEDTLYQTLKEIK